MIDRLMRALRGAAVLVGLVVVLVHGQALAQNVLVLTTNEPIDQFGPGNNGNAHFVNLVQEFTATGASVTQQAILDGANAVTPATFVLAGGGRYDMVVVASVYNAVDSSNWTAINNAIAARSANAFMMFVDSCCIPANNAAVGAAFTASGAFSPTLGSNTFSLGSFPLNTASPYSTSFTGLNPLHGGYIQYFNNVPASNALYLQTGASNPAAGSTVNNVYGLLVPSQQSYNGDGACLFATIDMTPFSPAAAGDQYPQNAGKIAPAFLNAVRAGGACGVPASIAKAFAPTTLAPGGNATLTITVANSSNAPVTGLNVTDNLPAPLTVAGPANTTCTGGTLAATTGGSRVSLTNATLPAAGCTITVPVQWPVGQAALCRAPGTTVTNTITPGTDFTTSQGQVNTPATATLSCLGDAPSPKSVPTLSQWALLALTLLLGAMAWAQTRRQAGRGGR